MKTIRLLLLGVTAACLFSSGVLAQPRPQNRTNTLADIAAKYDAMKREVEKDCQRKTQAAIQRTQDLDASIKKMEEKAVQLRQSLRKLEATRNTQTALTDQEYRAQLAALEDEVKRLTQATGKAKEDLKSAKAQLAEIEREKEKIIAQLEQAKQREMRDTEKQREESARR